MIRIATVFSGIGAIEHALDRMNLDHEIVFACDNGDVDILTKDIGMSIDDIQVELNQLSQTISAIRFNDAVQDLYKEQLAGMLSEAKLEYTTVCKKLDKIPSGVSLVTDILQCILGMTDIATGRRKEYTSFVSNLKLGSASQQKFKSLQTILEIANDFKKDNDLDKLGSNGQFNSADKIDWKIVSAQLKQAYDFLEKNDGKKIIRKVQDLSQRTSQLHEKINYLKVQRELNVFGDDWNAKKKLVDSLYEGLESRNKVKQSYMANYSVPKEHFHWNVAFLDGTQYRGKVDLFVGGSPCQSFSLVGKQRGLDDTRGTLFYEYARLIDEIKPKVFIYENVKAVTFAVPNNLYIIGTMNSADKSIALIDTALRRRFEFEEVAPNPELIVDETLKKVLVSLNELLRKQLESSDLLIGHAYFIGKTAADLSNILNRNIIPLLYEYFYDQEKKVKDALAKVLEGTDVSIAVNNQGRIKVE